MLWSEHVFALHALNEEISPFVWHVAVWTLSVPSIVYPALHSTSNVWSVVKLSIGFEESWSEFATKADPHVFAAQAFKVLNVPSVWHVAVCTCWEFWTKFQFYDYDYLIDRIHTYKHVTVICVSRVTSHTDCLTCCHSSNRTRTIRVGMRETHTLICNTSLQCCELTSRLARRTLSL